MSQISIPHCYLPNSLVQVFDTETSFRSEFQINTLKQISEREDFAYFVTVQHGGTTNVVVNEEDCSCPFVNMWYATNGDMHCTRIGMKRILTREHIITGNDAVSLDSPVYASRTVH